jgi:chromosome segregation ATPase
MSFVIVSLSSQLKNKNISLNSKTTSRKKEETNANSMGRPKGTKRIALNNGTEEWFEFCTKEDALAYVERGWCTTEDVVKHWPEKNSNNEVTLSEMEKRMESIEDSIESFNDNLATLMEAIKTLTQQRESSILQQNAPAVTEKQQSWICLISGKCRDTLLRVLVWAGLEPVPAVHPDFVFNTPPQCQLPSEQMRLLICNG